MKPANRFRRLTDEEIALWRAVAQTVEPRHGSVLPDVPLPPTPQPIRLPDPATGKRKLPPPLPSYSPPVQTRGVAPPLTVLDRRYKQSVARGRVEIGRVIDLHGLTQAQAHSALRHFLRSAQGDDVRLVLVVTGKGDRSRPGEHDIHGGAGVLRRLVPHWLREADLRAIVLGFEEAGLPHGGAGALYIRLRRRRVPA